MKSAFPLLALFAASGLTCAGPLDDLENHLRHDLDGRCIGYGFAIYQNGAYVRGGGGGVRKTGDPDNIFDPGLPFNENTVKDCHSMSKVITAAAMLKALGDSGLGLDAKMWNYLPKIMQDAVPPDDLDDVKEISFRHLLNHTSGFGFSSNYSWHEVKSQLEGGLDNNVGDSEYSNWGYAICRILIPYVLNLDYYRDFEDDTFMEEFFLPSLTASTYAEFVNSDVFSPAGLQTIHPRPVDSTIGNFGWYYDFRNPTSPGSLMPDRRLTVGSGGWALSAKQYGRFISGLFNNQIVSGTQLGWMKTDRLGMESIGAIDGGEDYLLHNGATNSGSNGGRSFWIHFPTHNIQIAIQINSAGNNYSAYGMGLSALVRDAYERAYTTPPWSLQWARHLFVRRAGDGWTAGLGIDGSGEPADRNYDYKAPAGFEFTRFFDVAGKPFVLHYKPVNGGGSGRALMQGVNADGTMGATVFDTSGWLGGWTHMETFKTWQGTFLLLHNHNTGRIRTFQISPLGTLGPAITDFAYNNGFETLEIIDFGVGDTHLFRHNPVTGQSHLRKLNDDGSVGATQYDHVWNTGFTDFSFYRAGDTNYLLRYNPVGGNAHISSFGNSLVGIQQELDQIWSKGWTNIRFFEIGTTTYNFRYNPVNGTARIQRINDNGLFGEIVYESSNWLHSLPGSGSFNPPTTGWTEVQFYDATPGVLPPGNLANNPNPPPAETGASIEPLGAGTATTTFASESLPPIQATVRIDAGNLRTEWFAETGTLYFHEESTDLKKWSIVEAVVGNGGPMSSTAMPDPSGIIPARKFVRLRAIPSLTLETGRSSTLSPPSFPR